MTNWQNADGLQVPFGQDQARETASMMGKTANNGPMGYMVLDVNWDDLPDFTADLNNDGTNNGWSDKDAYIPAGSYITRATFIVETAFASGTDYDVATYEQDGTLIDLNGINEALLVSELAANEVHQADGDLVNGTLNLTLDSYIRMIPNGAFTAGKAKLVIEYIQVAP